jgi:hypothetical protein
MIGMETAKQSDLPYILSQVHKDFSSTKLHSSKKASVIEDSEYIIFAIFDRQVLVLQAD